MLTKEDQRKEFNKSLKALRNVLNDYGKTITGYISELKERDVIIDALKNDIELLKNPPKEEPKEEPKKE